MRLCCLTYNKGYPYETSGELGAIELEVSKGNRLRINEVPREKELMTKLEDVVLTHLWKNGVLKCL